MIKVLSFASACLLLSACSSNQVNTLSQAQVTIENQSEKIVNLSYQYSSFDSSVINWNKLKSTATNQCTASGYKYAELFNQAPVTCDSRRQNDFCESWSVAVSYQCTSSQQRPQSTVAMNL